MGRGRCRPFSLALLAALVARPAAAAETGTITGVIDQPARVKAVMALDRATDRRYPGKVDPKSGRFTVTGLPLGAAYDCQIDYEAARVEGVNLEVRASDLEQEQPLREDDAKAIKAATLALNKFEDRVEVLAVRGNVQHAAVLVIKLRTRPFVNSRPGEVVWRLELRHFERPDETWVKEQDELFIVLYRERIAKAEYDRKALAFEPALGGLRVTREKPRLDLGTVRLPPARRGVWVREAEGAGGRKGG
jgi:hypothetical protein